MKSDRKKKHFKMIETDEYFDYKSIDDAVAFYADTVYRLAYAYTGNAADSEDIMQDVFVRYVKRRPVFENGAHQKAWFLKVTANRCKTLLLSKWKKNTALTDVFPVTSAEERESDDRIPEAVSKLKGNQKIVVHMFYYEDMSIKAIADSLGMPESTVKSHLKRAKKNLRNLLEEEDVW